MRKTQRRRPSSATGLILVLLALVAILGLLSGFLTHLLISRASVSANAQPTSTERPAATVSNTSTPVPVTGITGTATSGAASGQFVLSVSISPKAMTPGEQITITVRAFTPDTHAPISGLTCALRAPTDGSPALFSSWPPAQTTDDSGAAVWTLTAPQKAPGTYEVEAYARTAQWSYLLRSSAQLDSA